MDIEWIGISIGAIIGYVGKEGMEVFKGYLQGRREKKKAYFDKKVEVAINSIRLLNSFVIDLRNCSMILRFFKHEHQRNNVKGMAESLKMFATEYKAIHKRAKEFPHEVFLFFSVPSFHVIFSEFNEILEMFFKLYIPLFDSKSESEMKIEEIHAVQEEIESMISRLAEFIEKFEGKSRLLENCLEEMKNNLRQYE